MLVLVRKNRTPRLGGLTFISNRQLNTVKVIILTVGKVCIFWSQTLHVDIEYAVA